MNRRAANTLLLGLLMVSLTLWLAPSVWAAPSVTMTARAAQEGRHRYGGWATVVVDLSNQGSEFTGEVVVSPDSEGPERGYQYVVPLTIAAGGRKKVPVNLPVSNTSQATVQLRSGGSVLREEVVRLTAVAPDTLFVAVLSDDELGVPALSQLPSGAGTMTPQVTRLDAASFPDSAGLLEQFDIIALSRFDTSNLTKAQAKALEGWVGRGGTLLLTGGPEWKRTLGSLPPALVPVSISGVSEVDLAPLGAILNRPSPGKGPVSEARVVHGQVMAGTAAQPLIVSDSVGVGKVLFLAVDPGLQPIVTWQHMPELLSRYLGVQPRMAQMEFGNTDGQMQGALQRMPGLGLPSAGVVAALLLGYLLLVGPLSYWVLKRLDKREWTWVTVPVLSLAFVGVIYLVGFGRNAAVFSHLITVTELVPGTDTATMDSFVGIYAPSLNRVEVAVEDARLVKPLGGYGPMGTETTNRVILGDKTTVQMLDLNNYSMKGLAVERDVTVKGRLELTDMKVMDDGTVMARVVNNLDQPLTDVLLFGPQSTYQLGELAPGATSDLISLSTTGSSGPRNREIWQTAFQAPINSMGQQMDVQRKRETLAAVVGWGGERITPGTIMLVGWTAAPLAEPGVPMPGKGFSDTNMVYQSIALRPDLSTGNLPPGLVVGVRSVGSGKYGVSSSGFVLADGSSTFSLVLPPFDSGKVGEVFLHLNIYLGPPTYAVQVRDQKSGEWVSLAAESVQPLKNWQDLISPSGLLEIKIDVREHLEMAAPTISMKGVGR